MYDDLNEHPQAIFAAAESEALNATPWERWVAKAERLIGHNLDGDDSDAAKAAGIACGYSLDEAHDYYRRGATPEAYVVMVSTRDRYRA